MSIQNSIDAALTAALHDGNYRPIAAAAQRMYLKRGQRGSLEKYIRYDFPLDLWAVASAGLTLETFLVELYKTSVRATLITLIITQTHTLLA